MCFYCFHDLLLSRILAASDGDIVNGYYGDDGTDTDTDTKSTRQTTKKLAFYLQMEDHHFSIVRVVEQMTKNADTCQMTVHFNAFLTIAYKSGLCACIQ